MGGACEHTYTVDTNTEDAIWMTLCDGRLRVIELEENRVVHVVVFAAKGRC